MTDTNVAVDRSQPHSHAGADRSSSDADVGISGRVLAFLCYVSNLERLGQGRWITVDDRPGSLIPSVFDFSAWQAANIVFGHSLKQSESDIALGLPDYEAPIAMYPWRWAVVTDDRMTLLGPTTVDTAFGFSLLVAPSILEATQGKSLLDFYACRFREEDHVVTPLREHALTLPLYRAQSLPDIGRVIPDLDVSAR